MPLSEPVTTDATAVPWPSVTIVLASTCEPGKRDVIRRAIDSVLSQQDVVVSLIVVVNGSRSDIEVLGDLKGDPRATVCRFEEGHVSKARYFGARMVVTEFFGFLDDDDELLPYALRDRIAAMRSQPAADVLVTNGFIYERSDILHVPQTFEQAIRTDPALSFLEHNWFASPASLFRRATVPIELFDIPYRYFEWTYLFFRLLSQSKTIAYSNIVTYRKYEDHPYSVSRTLAYRLSLPEVLLHLLRLPLAPDVLKRIRRNYIGALNFNSTLFLADGQLRHAVEAHISCLFAGGWQYLPYTRRLVSIFFRQIAGIR